MEDCETFSPTFLCGVPRLFETRTGSSRITESAQTRVTAGSAARPNCTTKPGTTRKNPESSK